MEIMQQQGMEDEPMTIVDSVAEALSNVVVTYFKAHGFHWNVMGSDFAQFHDFFAEIYEDVYSSIDPLAEILRKMGSLAPYKLSEFMSMSDVQDSSVGTNALAMVADLRVANSVTLESLVDAFDIANAQNEQGICNFIAERIDMHQKWNWQLTSYLVEDSPEVISTDDSDYAPMPSLMDMPGKSDAAQPLEALIVDEPEDDGVAEQLDDADNISGISADEQEPDYNCPLCTAGYCHCPGCICDEACRCPMCHANMENTGIVLAASGASSRKRTGSQKISFGAKTDKALADKVESHNAVAPLGRRTTLSTLKAVYRRGASVFSSSQASKTSCSDVAMQRVDAFLRLLNAGVPQNRSYVQDNDLLPVKHPRSSRDLSAMSSMDNLSTELVVSLKEENDYASSEQAILAIAELSGHGYEMIPAIRAAWLRGIRDKQSPFNRAVVLASALYDSPDSDLLPKL